MPAAISAFPKYHPGDRVVMTARCKHGTHRREVSILSPGILDPEEGKSDRHYFYIGVDTSTGDFPVVVEESDVVSRVTGRKISRNGEDTDES